MCEENFEGKKYMVVLLFQRNDFCKTISNSLSLSSSCLFYTQSGAKEMEKQAKKIEKPEKKSV